MIAFDDIYNLLPFEYLCNLCDPVYGLWQRTNYQHEYGISWGDFLNEYVSEIKQVMLDWYEEVTDEEVVGWLKNRKAIIAVEIENLNNNICKIDAVIAAEEVNKNADL